DHELVIEGQDHAADDVEGVVGLEDPLWAIVEPAVADQDAEAADREIVAVILREAVDGAADPEPVVRASPGPAFDRGAEREAPIDIGESRDLALAVVPAPAPEQAEVVGDGLLEVHVIAVLGAAGPRENDRIGGIEIRVEQGQVD